MRSLLASLRGRLMLMMLAAALPAFALIGYLAYRQHDLSSPGLLWVGLLGLGAAMALGLAFGWLGGRMLVLEPMQPIFATVGRVASGDLSARTGVAPSFNEISQLAGEVDAMAAALQERDRTAQRERDRAQTYLDLVGVIVVTLDRDGRIVLANRKTCELLGCEPAGRCVGGDWFDQFVPPEQREEARRVFRRVMDGTGAMPDAHENLVQTRAGECRLVAWRNTVLRDAEGRITGTISAGHDITDIRHLQKDLLASRDRFQTLVENIPGTVFRCELGYPWRVEHISRSVLDLTGIEPARFVAGEVRYGELIHPEDLPEVERAIGVGVVEARPYATEYRVRHADGTWRWAHERGGAILDASGQPRWLDGVIMDITERKQMQAEQERLQAQLQQAHKMEALGQLTGGIAHDFNNILASVLGFAKLALRRHAPDANGELAECLREIIVAGERARDLVAKMLAFGRSQPSRVAQPLAALPLAQEAVKMLAATIPSSIRVETRFEADLPDIAIDSVAFHQILVNLVINARDAVGDKGRITVSLRRRRMDDQECCACHRLFSGDYVELTVADSGLGIAPEALPRIFEPFFTTKAVGQGTGLGLAMVHGLVNRADGHFQIESRPGSGTVFSIFLPVAGAAAGAVAATPEPAAAAAFPPGHVLVVDDEPAILHLLRASLADAGWRVSAFTSPGQALAAFRDHPHGYDALITDQTMPELSGVELTAAVRRLRPDLPVILCTGYSDGLTDTVARQWGVDRFLHKPVDVDILLAALADAGPNMKAAT